VVGEPIARIGIGIGVGVAAVIRAIAIAAAGIGGAAGGPEQKAQQEGKEASFHGKACERGAGGPGRWGDFPFIRA
jgi:hypothetical protein